MLWASWTVTVVTIYALLGVVFALAFVTRGVARVDPAAAVTPLGFKLLLLPGVAATWPYFAWRWWVGRQPPVERNAHRGAAGGER